MGIKASVEKLDDVGDLKDHYKEHKDKDGKVRYVLDIEDFDAHPSVRGLAVANQENVRKRDEYKSKVTELEAKVTGLPEDFDSTEWDRLKALDKGQKPDEQIQALKESHHKALDALRQKHSKELAEREGKIIQIDGEIDNRLLESGLKDALLESGVNPDLLGGALGMVRSKAKVVKDDKGDRKPVATNEFGEEVPLADFAKSWLSGKDGKPYLGKAEGPGGRGSKTPMGGAKTMSRSDFDRMDPAAQMKAMTQDGVQVVD